MSEIASEPVYGEVFKEKSQSEWDLAHESYYVVREAKLRSVI